MLTETNSATLSKSDFTRLSSFIYDQCGIKMPDSKKIMVEARLRKRLKDLQMHSYGQYCEFLFSQKGSEEEITQMVDVITTNKTDFFREPKQFNFLTETALSELLNTNGAGIQKPLKAWSAGCSTGEEPYTLSIVLSEFAQNFSRYSFNILATDISTRVLEKAATGIYDEERTEPILRSLMQKYFLRSKNKEKKLVRVIPELRRSINFQWLNFMENDFGIKEKFDLIFCRNVIIYFDKPTQDRLIAKLLSYLKPGGYFFLGHSESIFDTNLPIIQVAASTYKKTR
ncbi:MAG: CheR family methyltransferase [Ignavibacteriaceae bacterium]|jgi:chemotaxis protein methyltransferase CheR